MHHSGLPTGPHHPSTPSDRRWSSTDRRVALSGPGGLDACHRGIEQGSGKVDTPHGATRGPRSSRNRPRIRRRSTSRTRRSDRQRWLNGRPSCGCTQDSDGPWIHDGSTAQVDGGDGSGPDCRPRERVQVRAPAAVSLCSPDGGDLGPGRDLPAPWREQVGVLGDDGRSGGRLAARSFDDGNAGGPRTDDRCGALLRCVRISGRGRPGSTRRPSPRAPRAPWPLR